MTEAGRPQQQAEPSALPVQQRERLFHAALAVALERGFGHVTMDAVARRAGVSKGGLLYHFPSKTHLVRALLERYVKQASHSACGEIDLHTVAVLIAAAEYPFLLETLAGPEEQPAAGAETEAVRRWRILMDSLPKQPS